VGSGGSHSPSGTSSNISKGNTAFIMFHYSTSYIFVVFPVIVHHHFSNNMDGFELKGRKECDH
jgi:hypothetical protein